MIERAKAERLTAEGRTDRAAVARYRATIWRGVVACRALAMAMGVAASHEAEAQFSGDLSQLLQFV